MSDPVLPPIYEITNLLTDAQQTFMGPEVSTSSVSGWIAGDDGDGPTCLLERSTEQQKFEPASLRVEALVTDPVWVATDGYVTVTPGTTYRGFAWVRTEAQRLFVRVGIEWANAALSTTSWSTASWTESEVVASSGWTLISFQGVAPDGADGSVIALRARLRVQLVNPQVADVFWVDDAVLTSYISPDSPMLRMAQRWFPEYLRLLDAEQTSPTVPMDRFFDLTATTATRFLRAALAFDYIPATDGVDGYERSTLVDARYYPATDYAEERWLDWLAYITGCRLYVSSRVASSGRTPWYRIEDDVTDWTAIEALGSWELLENAFPQSAEAAISKVASIRSQGTGIWAGTVEGMRRAARLVLSGFDKSVMVSRTDGIGTAAFESYESVTVGDVLDLYDTGIADLDDRITVTSVSDVDGQRTISFVSDGADVAATSGYITSSLVDVTLGVWSSRIAELVDDGSGNPRVTTVRPLPTTWKNQNFYPDFVDARPGGATFTFDGNGITVLDSGDPKSVFTPADGAWFSYEYGEHTFVIVWNDYITPMSESDTGIITISNCGVWFVLVETLESQTPDPDVVIGAVNYAKPAGCVVTHRYTAL